MKNIIVLSYQDNIQNLWPFRHFHQILLKCITDNFVKIFSDIPSWYFIMNIHARECVL